MLGTIDSLKSRRNLQYIFNDRFSSMPYGYFHYLIHSIYTSNSVAEKFDDELEFWPLLV